METSFALTLTAAERRLWIVALGEARGGEFDYKRGRWFKGKEPQVV